MVFILLKHRPCLWPPVGYFSCEEESTLRNRENANVRLRSIEVAEDVRVEDCADPAGAEAAEDEGAGAISDRQRAHQAP